MSDSGETKDRGANWTQDELKLLIESIGDDYDKLVGAFSNNLTQKDKNAIWLRVASTVNSVSNKKRSAEDVKSKFTVFKSRSKKKAANFAEMKKTGGGSINEVNLICELEERCNSLSQNEKAIVKMMGPVAILGIDNGIDTASQKVAAEEESQSTAFDLTDDEQHESTVIGSDVIELSPIIILSKSQSRKRLRRRKVDQVSHANRVTRYS